MSDAVREGRITPQPCDRCGGEADPLVESGKLAGWRCYPCRRLPEGAYYVYVIELDRGGVYVGQSALFPAERFAQHLNGYKAASVVRHHGVRLRPDLFERWNPIPSRAEAEAMEARLAARLRAHGYRVFGGH
ncbi:MAG: GIY-YIG nuclease family protein [Chloroflexi bacterium]|nr:GIY-YIG nuclease family protein [Chloroflexota bacterium]